MIKMYKFFISIWLSALVVSFVLTIINQIWFVFWFPVELIYVGCLVIPLVGASVFAIYCVITS
jgi:hypothetical protein